MITAQPLDPGDGQVEIVVFLDGADDLQSLPRGADLSMKIAGVDQADQLGAAAAIEAFVGSGGHSPIPVQRVVLVPAMFHRLVSAPAHGTRRARSWLLNRAGPYWDRRKPDRSARRPFPAQQP